MSVSVLGKRTRASPCSALTEAQCVQTRAKRRSIAVLGNDENENPFVRSVRHDQSKPTVDTLLATRPAKHGNPQTRVVASPRTINSHFAVTKSSVSVSKDEKSAPSTPQTPRHRDALSTKIAITPRHRVPSTPSTPSTPTNANSSVYNQARQIFSRCTDPSVLVGRDDEKRQLSEFISTRLESKRGGCLYVSGPPGTGKSAFVSRVCEAFISRDDISISTVNCMSIKSAKDLAALMSSNLNTDCTTETAAGIESLRARFMDESPEAQSYILVLDEIDRLVDLDLKLLYSLFDWSMLPSSNLILIGIANALDLTDRFLPRLKSRSIKPDLLPFMPYTAPQIAEIISAKLRALVSSSDSQDPTFLPFLHPAAIQFCSKKVASQTGDLRKAFDICRRAIDLAEQDAKAEQARLRLQESPSKTPLMENVNLSSPPVRLTTPVKSPRQAKLTSSPSHLTLTSAPRATIAHMAKVTSQVFSNGTSQRLATLNMQQKAVLCSLCALESKRASSPSTSIFATPSKSNTAAPTVKQLYEAYTQLCRRENLLHPLSSLEFRDVVSGLEAQSLVSAADKGTSSFAPVTPSRTPSRKGKGGFGFSAGMAADEKRLAGCVGKVELLGALKGPGSEILREMIEGEGVAL